MARKEQAEDKTGGSSERMAPGEEGRGGCVIRRRPAIMGEMTKESKKLYEQLLSVADYNGHKRLELWRVEAPGNCGSVKCLDCGKAAGFAEFPMSERIWVNEPTGPRVSVVRPKEKINGELVEQRCK